MTTKIIIALFATASLGMAQMAGRSPTDRTDIVQRLAASDLVVIGTIVKQDLYPGVSLSAKYAAITQQTPREELLTLSTQAAVEMGTLYTIRVDSELCRGNDFQSNASTRSSASEKELHVFKPASDMAPKLDDPDPVEMFDMNGKYLLSLKQDTQSETLIKTFGLDAGRTYYRAVGRARGAIQLEMSTYQKPPFFEMGLKNAPEFGDITLREPSPPSKYTLPAAVLEANTREAAAISDDAKAMCQAVSPANALQKADGLQRLKSSPDLVMRGNADIALKLLRGEPLR